MAVYCPNCGKQLPDYAEFCDNCGTRIPSKKPQDVRKDPAPAREPEKKKSSAPMKILKWILILAVAGGLGLVLLDKLESIFHRTPPADPPVQQTVKCFNAILSYQPTLSFPYCVQIVCVLCCPASRIVSTIFLDSIYMC